MQLHTVILVLTFSYLASAQSDSPWAWRCEDDLNAICVKERKAEGSAGQMSQEACKLTCGPYGSLMPFPRQTELGKTTTRFSPVSITKGITECILGVCPLLHEATEIFKKSIKRYHPDFSESPDFVVPFSPPVPGEEFILHISIDGNDEQLLLTTDESYALNVITEGTIIKVSITAPTFFGARHALETLSQLIDYNEEFNSLQIVSSATISDEPYYKYRGVIIDTARNFIPVDVLKRIIDGLSYDKLNTFHWHITDSQSFPMYVPSLPEMTRFGAYSQREVYKPEDVKKLVEYALVRGVRIIPELDAPAHVGQGWQWGPEAGLGNLAVCVNKQPWDRFCAGPPCGQVNIANPQIYTVISKIYKDWIAAFGPLEMFHYGGDEIFLECWNSTEEVMTWMKNKGANLTADAYYKEWSIFQDKVYRLFTEANNGVQVPGILWTSALTESSRIEKYLDKNKYIIQVWTKGDDPVIVDLLAKGYKLILSNYDKLYLDCGFGSWVSAGGNWCAPYKEWQDLYGNDITAIMKNAGGVKDVSGQVLGAEAAVWSEQIDEHTLGARIWPRASALAERLWSDPFNNYKGALTRILEQRRRLALRGLKPSRLQPEWCRQHPLDCQIKCPAGVHAVEHCQSDELTKKESSGSEQTSYSLLTLLLLYVTLQIIMNLHEF